MMEGRYVTSHKVQTLSITRTVVLHWPVIPWQPLISFVLLSRRTSGEKTGKKSLDTFVCVELRGILVL
jgi:hypothetical protein